MPRAGLDAEAVVVAAAQLADAEGLAQLTLTAALIDVLVAVLRGYELHGDDAIHAVRLLRAALDGFVSLEREGGFAMPVDLRGELPPARPDARPRTSLSRMSASVIVADNPVAERYELTVEGECIGFVTYRIEPGVIALLHAEVNPAHERQGWGSRLVAGALADARGRGLKVRPVCPFVVAYIARGPGDRDLLA